MKYQFQDVKTIVSLSALIEDYQGLMSAVTNENWDDVRCVMECLADTISKADTGLKFQVSENSLVAMGSQNGVICRENGSDIQCANGYNVSDAGCEHCDGCWYKGIGACNPSDGELKLACGYTYNMAEYASDRDNELLEALSNADDGDRASEWVCTDDDCLQFRREIFGEREGKCFELAQINLYPSMNGKEYCVSHGVIYPEVDVDDDDVKQYICEYGWSEEDIDSDSFPALLAEAVFESSGSEHETKEKYKTFDEAAHALAKLICVDVSRYLKDSEEPKQEETASEWVCTDVDTLQCRREIFGKEKGRCFELAQINQYGPDHFVIAHGFVYPDIDATDEEKAEWSDGSPAHLAEAIFSHSNTEYDTDRNYTCYADAARDIVKLTHLENIPLNKELPPASVVSYGERTIHVCPNNCGATFVTSAHVSQDWEVDAEGNFIECCNGAVETVAGPDDDNCWTCSECGSEGKRLSSQAYSIGDNNSYQYGGVLYVTSEGVYWYGIHTNGAVKLDPTTENGNIYYLTPEIGSVEVTPDGVKLVEHTNP